MAIAMKTLILGLGNTLLGDDGVGILLARELEKVLSPSNGFTVMESSLWGLALIDLILGFDHVIILDAIKTGKYRVGNVHEIKVADFTGLSSASTPHFVGLPTVLRLGQELGLDVPSQISVIGIEVNDPYSFGENLTPELKKNFPRILHQILRILQDESESRKATAS
jgi:hydrogenase maturation protease